MHTWDCIITITLNLAKFGYVYLKKSYEGDSNFSTTTSYLPSATVVAERLCFYKHLLFCPQGAYMVGEGHV